MQPETLWDRIKQGLTESATTAAQRAEYLGRVGRARLDIAETRHAIRDAFSELGGTVYSHLEENINTAVGKKEDVQSLIEKIKGLEGVLKDREARLQTLRSGAEGAGESAEAEGESKAEESDA